MGAGGSCSIGTSAGVGGLALDVSALAERQATRLAGLVSLTITLTAKLDATLAADVAFRKESDERTAQQRAAFARVLAEDLVVTTTDIESQLPAPSSSTTGTRQVAVEALLEATSLQSDLGAAAASLRSASGRHLSLIHI